MDKPYSLANQPHVLVWLTEKQAYDVFIGNYKDSGISYDLFKSLTDKTYPKKCISFVDTRVNA